MGQRINKYLSGAGVCSRREADRLIDAGRVRIDEKKAVMGSMVEDGQTVYVDDKKVEAESEEILIVVNKPKGIVCTTTDNQGTNNIVDFIGYKKRIYPIGRLDKDSEGLLLMTNNGDLMDKILRSANGHEKEYIVSVDKKITRDFIDKMAAPMYLEELDRTTKKCRVRKTGDKTFVIVLTQGLNRQIRRMCANLGYKVTELKRIRIMNIMLGELQSGQYRKATKEEYNELIRLTGKDGFKK